ncbi:putative paraquat-inducible protein A [Paraburkholderia sp. MM5496-R1]|uniref:hypothetical protein n=1 Tax=unclassified Paraburkholderia TaxID=2615204 RepID=UPI003D1FA0F3
MSSSPDNDVLQTFPTLVVCEHCDSVYRRRVLARREVARCEQCSAVLYRASQFDLDRWLALRAANIPLSKPQTVMVRDLLAHCADTRPRLEREQSVAG